MREELGPATVGSSRFGRHLRLFSSHRGLLPEKRTPKSLNQLVWSILGLYSLTLGRSTSGRNNVSVGATKRRKPWWPASDGPPREVGTRCLSRSRGTRQPRWKAIEGDREASVLGGFGNFTPPGAKRNRAPSRPQSQETGQRGTVRMGQRNPTGAAVKNLIKTFSTGPSLRTTALWRMEAPHVPLIQGLSHGSRSVTTWLE